MPFTIQHFKAGDKGNSKRINETPGNLLNFDSPYALLRPYTERVVAHMSPNHGTPTPTLEVAWVSREKFKVKMRGTEVPAAF